jgi:hypothetical protein
MTIDNPSDAVGFPAFIPAGHILASYSDSAFHRDCYARWEGAAELQHLYDQYCRIWEGRPLGASFVEIENWGRKAFLGIFESGMVKGAPGEAQEQ